MVVGRGHGGGRITPEEAVEIFVFRRCYKMSRKEIAGLPVWERALLLQGGRSSLGFDGEQSANNEDLSDADVRRIISGG